MSLYLFVSSLLCGLFMLAAIIPAHCPLGTSEPVPASKAEWQYPANQTDNSNDSDTNWCVIQGFLGFWSALLVSISFDISDSSPYRRDWV